MAPTISYSLRGIDPDLWRLTKAKAALEGKSLRQVIHEQLQAYVDAVGDTQDDPSGALSTR